MKLILPESDAEQAPLAPTAAQLQAALLPAQPLGPSHALSPQAGVSPRLPTAGYAANRAAQLNRDAVLSATPVRLLTMLYDRLLLDLARAESAQISENWSAANEQLQHAQAILSELSGSLKMDAWDGAAGLLALYTYVTNALVVANVHRDTERIREAITLLEPLRSTWHDAAALVPAQADSSASHVGGFGIA